MPFDSVDKHRDEDAAPYARDTSVIDVPYHQIPRGALDVGDILRGAFGRSVEVVRILDSSDIDGMRLLVRDL